MDQVHIIQFCYLCESTLASALAITIAIMFGTGTCATCTIEQLTMQTALSVHSACERNSNDKVLYMGSHLYSVGSHRNRSHKSYDNYIYTYHFKV